MAWTDEPSYAQINCIYRWFSWRMTNEEAMDASDWLKKHATRKEVSTEMNRLKKLFDSHNLDRKTAFSSDIWADYKPKE